MLIKLLILKLFYVNKTVSKHLAVGNISCFWQGGDPCLYTRRLLRKWSSCTTCIYHSFQFNL